MIPNPKPFPPLHPLRLTHSLEGTLRREWERFLLERPNFDILCGPEVEFAEIPPGIESNENKLTGGHQPYPYGRMTERDRMVAAELIQWIGSPIGLSFITSTFAKAGGRVEFDDFAVIRNSRISSGKKREASTALA